MSMSEKPSPTLLILSDNPVNADLKKRSLAYAGYTNIIEAPILPNHDESLSAYTLLGDEQARPDAVVILLSAISKRNAHRINKRAVEAQSEEALQLLHYIRQPGSPTADLPVLIEGAPQSTQATFQEAGASSVASSDNSLHGTLVERLKAHLLLPPQPQR